MERTVFVRRIPRQLRQIWTWPLIEILLLTGGASVVLVLLLGPVAMWATPSSGLHGKDKADAINATRQTLLAAGGGIVLLLGAAFTARTFHLSRRGQLSDRYTKALTLLASERMTERLGGIYALEHLMIDSRRDHSTVLEVLAAFVREQTASTVISRVPWNAEHRHEEGDEWPRIATDVQAALTVIGRRRPRPDHERNRIDLSVADLCGADLRGLNFENASFWRTTLRSARMQRTQLAGANLSWAELQQARLVEADLRNAGLVAANLKRAVLIGAQLQHADLGDANLEGAYLGEADLHKANLHGATLRGTDFIAYATGEPAEPVKGLTADQLANADIDDTTRLPEELRSRGGPDTTLRVSPEAAQHDGARQPPGCPLGSAALRERWPR